MPNPNTVTAALVVIGEEILSGRTEDANIAYLAAYLTRIGILLREVRVVRDIEDEIVAAVNALRARYTYVFTTGGIGPTHDDVTTDAIAKAFGVEVVTDPEAVAAMRKRFSEQELTSARLRMARIPAGASLIDNAISRAPGYMIGNVIVMAGVPRIMQVMLDAVSPRLSKGRPMLARSVRVDAPEGDVAPGLAELQAAHPKVQIGSYPFFENKRLGTYVVLRSVDSGRLEAAEKALWILIGKEGFAAAAAEAIRVRDVGIEGGPHQVHAAADDAGRCTAVAARGCMAELVEACRHRRQREGEHQHRRAVEKLAGGASEAFVEKQPPNRDRKANNHRDHDGRQEEVAERRSEGARHPLVEQREPAANRQQRVGLREWWVGPVGVLQHTKRAELFLGEILDVVRTGGLADTFGNRCCDLLVRPLPVDAGDHDVQQVGELDRLARREPNDRGWLFETGMLELADELQPIGEFKRSLYRDLWRLRRGHFVVNNARV